MLGLKAYSTTPGYFIIVMPQTEWFEIIHTDSLLAVETMCLKGDQMAKTGELARLCPFLVIQKILDLHVFTSGGSLHSWLPTPPLSPKPLVAYRFVPLAAFPILQPQAFLAVERSPGTGIGCVCLG